MANPLGRVNPSMLVVARESRGLTQTAFARTIGAGQATISKAEGGIAAPSDELLQSYADHLQYPIDFFHDQLELANLPLTFFRKRARLGANAIKQIRARTNVVRLHLSKLMQAIDPLPNRVPSIDLAAFKGSPEDVAAELRLKWRLPDGPIVSMTDLVERLGVLVIPFDFGTDQIDGLSMQDQRQELPHLIFVSTRIPGDRQRHTLAHELAHLILHVGDDLPNQDCEEDAYSAHRDQ